MADWTYQPQHRYRLGKDGPDSLISTFEDKTESRRRKSNAIRHRYREVHAVDSATMGAMLDFYDTYGTDLSFTKIEYNPQNATPLTDEVTCRFAEPLDPIWVGPDEWDVVIDFWEVL